MQAGLLFRIIAAAVIAAALFGSGWTAQGWHRDSLEKERVEKQSQEDLAVARTNAATDVRRLDRVIAAQNSATARAAVMRTAVADLSNERDGLRAELAEARLSLAGQSNQACLDRVSALDRVFEACTARYSDLAERSERHVSDIKSMIDSWPD